MQVYPLRYYVHGQVNQYLIQDYLADMLQSTECVRQQFIPWLLNTLNIERTKVEVCHVG